MARTTVTCLVYVGIVSFGVVSSTLLQALYNSDEPLLLDEQKSRKIADEWAKGKSKANDGKQDFFADIGYNYDDAVDQNVNPNQGDGYQDITSKKETTRDQFQTEKELKDVFRDENKPEDADCPKDTPVYREYGTGKCATPIKDEEKQVAVTGKSAVTGKTEPEHQHQVVHLLNYLEETSGKRKKLISGGQSQDHQQSNRGHFIDQGVHGGHENTVVDSSFEDQFGYGRDERVGSTVNYDEELLDQSQPKDFGFGQVTKKPIRVTNEQHTNQFSGNFDQIAQETGKPIIQQNHVGIHQEDTGRFREQVNQQNQQVGITGQITNDGQPSRPTGNNYDQTHRTQTGSQHPVVQKPTFDLLDYDWDSSMETQGKDQVAQTNIGQREQVDSYEQTGSGNDLQQQQQQQGSNRFKETFDQSLHDTQVRDQKPERYTGQPITGDQITNGHTREQRYNNDLGPSISNQPSVSSHPVSVNRPEPTEEEQDNWPIYQLPGVGYVVGNNYGGQNRPNPGDDIIHFPDESNTIGHRPWDHKPWDHNHRPWDPNHRPGESSHERPTHPDGFSCYGRKTGYYPSSRDNNCHYFYRCGPDGRSYRFKCAKGTLFHPTILKCLHAGQVKCYNYIPPV